MKGILAVTFALVNLTSHIYRHFAPRLVPPTPRNFVCVYWVMVCMLLFSVWIKIEGNPAGYVCIGEVYVTFVYTFCSTLAHPKPGDLVCVYWVMVAHVDFQCVDPN